MTDQPVLKELMAKVREAKGPDRELDAAIYEAIFGTTYEAVASQYPLALSVSLPNFTASIDSAVGLVERVRPGWEWIVERYTHCAVATVSGSEGESFEERRFTPALALLAALLSSMIAQEAHADE